MNSHVRPTRVVILKLIIMACNISHQYVTPQLRFLFWLTTSQYRAIYSEKAFREANVLSVTSPASAFDFPTSPQFSAPMMSCSMPSKTVEWNRVVHYRVIPGVSDYSQEEWNSLRWSRDELSHMKNRESHRRALVRSLTKLRLMFNLQDDSYIPVSKR